MKRRCVACHGPVYLVRASFDVPNPDPDSLNPTIKVFGLGTWHCSNGCRKRTVTVNVYVGCGKESEFKPAGIGQWAIRDQYLLPTERQRAIAVEYGTPKPK